MIPDSTEISPRLHENSNEEGGISAGYRQCAAEALEWLLNLGYEPGHPLLRSLAAHLSKKRAYLEKMDLERYLVGDKDSGTRTRIETDKQIQKFLVEAAFRGCDLNYVSVNPDKHHCPSERF